MADSHGDGGGEIATWHIVVGLIALFALAGYLYVSEKNVPQDSVKPGSSVPRVLPLFTAQTTPTQK